ncbi:MAG: hypothetical protein LBM27_03965 [Lactobacillaceae bacterium]|jgi:hypothetical protein|nr:hypothetical protein [Lactobacillaceae bacterium]
MTPEEKFKKIESTEKELRQMYDAGDLGELIDSDIPAEHKRFLIKMQDYFRG